MFTEKLSFLGSPRFWKLFLVGCSAALEAYNVAHSWQAALLAGLGIWLGGSVAVGTIDKANAPVISQG